MAEDKAARERRSTQLREELKVWEKNFSADNAGYKPSREDIRANADIAAKYKEYNKLREIISGNVAPRNPPKPSKKRTSGVDVPLTPSKRQRTVDESPGKRKDLNSEEELAPAAEPTPVAKRTMMGPTPQRDGMFMGIFDDLPTTTAGTPTKLRSILGSIHANVARTPSRADDLGVDDTLLEERARPSRTPTSSSKRNLFAQFVTPGKKQAREEGTPSSARKLLFTPLFLRRDTVPLDTVEEEQQSPEVRRPWRPRNFMRTLSGMIQDRRKEEDERVDEEWEAMLELEGDAAPSKASGVPKIVVEDSQRPVVLDAEGFVPSEGEDTEVEEIPQLDRNGQPRKPYKKKGLKRQTRRVIMRPVSKVQVQESQPRPQQSEEESGDEEKKREEHIPETQAASKASVPEDEIVDDDNDSDAFSDHDITSYRDNEYSPAPETAKSVNTGKKAKEVPSKVAKTIKKRVVKPEAHANYVKLKIKNQNSKGNKGKGRFGRKNR